MALQLRLSSPPPSLLLLRRGSQNPNSAISKTLNLTLLPRKPCNTVLFAVAPEVDPTPVQPLVEQEDDESGLKNSLAVLKEAAKTRRVPASDVLTALSKVKKSKVDPTPFFETLGGTESPGRTWMLIFTAQGKLDKGRYFPVTAVQRFDAAGKRIENGIYLSPIGNLTFEGRLSFKKKILAFIFERVKIKIGPFGPLKIDFGKKDEREPSTKDPFFVWFYVDEEIAVAQGRGGGVAFWCRCKYVA
ncbi:hypothetical protein LUZ60_009858 [Juncus effusus]|nr:hypothetical protein LUZ60_009858 [Juncus effusus]